MPPIGEAAGIRRRRALTGMRQAHDLTVGDPCEQGSGGKGQWGERTVGERAVSETSVGEKAVSERAVRETAVRERAVGERAVRERERQRGQLPHHALEFDTDQSRYARLVQGQLVIVIRAGGRTGTEPGQTRTECAPKIEGGGR
jgi:hypothetical protein